MVKCAKEKEKSCGKKEKRTSHGPALLDIDEYVQFDLRKWTLLQDDQCNEVDAPGF
jgi:hypothetical protein